jgi:hypothetical protein
VSYLVFISDLVRPKSFEKAEFLVNQNADNEIVKKDFYNSLLAAFTTEEIESMLIQLRLNNKLKIERISDRHMIVYGSLIN